MTTNLSYPRQGQIFKTSDVFKLPLRESPFLRFRNKQDEDGWTTIQDTYSYPISELNWDDIFWKFEYETSEWCPIFRIIHENGDAYSDEETLAFVEKYLVKKPEEFASDRYLYYPKRNLEA